MLHFKFLYKNSFCVIRKEEEYFRLLVLTALLGINKMKFMTTVQYSHVKKYERVSPHK